MEDRMDAMQRQMDEKFQQLLDAMQNCQPRTGHRPHAVHEPLVGNRFACLGEADAPDITALEDDQDYIQTLDQYKSNASARGQRTRGSRTFDYSKIEPIADDAEFKDFKLWRKKWEANAKNKTLELFGRDEQVSAIMDAIGPTAASIVECYKKIDVNDKDTRVDDILTALHDYYRSNRNLALDREAFHKRVQGATETFAKFKCALDKLAEDADLCPSCSEDQIVTQIIIGIREDEIKEKLLQVQPFPTLEETMKICHTMESAIKNRETLHAKSVNKVSSYKKDKQRARSPGHKNSMEVSGGKRCQFCGGYPHPRDKCYARNTKCRKCSKIGHIEKVCRSTNRFKEDQRNFKAKVSSVFCGQISQGNKDKEDPSPICKLDTVSIYATAWGSNKTVRLHKVLPDSGSGANLMSKQDYERSGLSAKDLRRGNDVIYGANNLTINTLGRKTFSVQYGDVSETVCFIITDEYKNTLLNMETCKKLGLLPASFPKQVVPVNEVGHHSIDHLRCVLMKEFSDVFDTTGKLKSMKGSPIHIELTPDAKAFKVNGPRPIPIPYRQEARKLIMDLVAQCVLKEVTEPTDWVHPMTIVTKADGSLRLCVDLRNLNKFVKRPHHPVRSPKDAVSAIPPNSRYFTTCDAKSGYFQCELDEESQLLTTFITPWGRFKHLRATMGLSCAGDEFNRRTDAALAGIDNMEKVVDDIILHGENLEDHIANVRKFLTRCRESGITLNPKKFQFAQQQVRFAGYMVSDKGIEADPEKLKAIRCFPKPSNITDLRSFNGLVEQLAGFSKDVAGLMQPLRPLLSMKNDFIWTTDHDKAFKDVKKALVSPPILATFDPNRPTMLLTDAAKTKGLGYALLQQDNDNQWRLIDANSRFVSDTESRYAMVELELLGVVWAMRKCHNYLFGLRHFDLIVDHLPLVSILDKQTLDCIDNIRLQNLKTKTAQYNFTTKWRKGQDHKIADALSRAPIQDPSDDDLDDAKRAHGHVNTTYKANIATVNTLSDKSHADLLMKEVAEAAKNDEEYEMLASYLRSGKENIPKMLTHYKSVIHELWVDDGIILLRQRLLIPYKMRKDVLKRLHGAHQGIDKTLRRARQAVYWLGMSSDIKSTVEACHKCQRYKLSQAKEPMEHDPLPTRIFEEVAADFFELDGHHYLAMTDRYSGWLDLLDIGQAASSLKLIKCLKEYFSAKGCPVRLYSDGGKQFTSEETQKFMKSWGVMHRLSSPHYPQSNGLAESGVKSLKLLLKKCNGNAWSEEFRQGLLELRNSPRAGGKSPAEIVYGKPLRSRVPAHYSAFNPKWLVSLDEHDSKMAELANKTMEHYDKSARKLPPLKVGTRVSIQNATSKVWDRVGQIVATGPHRKYQVKCPSGRCLWRNRRFLRPIPNICSEPKTEEEEDDGIIPKSNCKELRRSKRVRFKVDRLNYHT